jgi:hypothetical protein
MYYVYQIQNVAPQRKERKRMLKWQLQQKKLL